MVVRTDPSVTEVWYHIDDADASNNDANTRTQGGNGNGFEPFTDTNDNGTRDASEPFEDLNANGVWDSNIATTWVTGDRSDSYALDREQLSARMALQLQQHPQRLDRGSDPGAAARAFLRGLQGFLA